MSDIFRFPNGGYDVTVVRKQDVLDAIDDNIIDKELALAVVKQCELDVAENIKEGKWTGIPFMGNIRIPDYTKIAMSDEHKELVATAKETLTHEKYVLFRRNLHAETGKRVKFNRYYRYLVSTIASKHKRLYKTLISEKGETYARLYMFTLNDINEVITDGEKFIDRQDD